MLMRIYFLALSALLIATSCAPLPRPKPVISDAPHSRSTSLLPGKQSDGSVLLPNQWSLRPVGRQIELRDFPVNVAVHPGGRFAAVLHSGYSSHQLSIIDLLSGE